MLASLDILNLLAELLDYGFERESKAGQLQVGRFGAQGVRLPVQLLAKKIEAAPDRSSFRQEIARGLSMRLQAIQLLGCIGALNQQRRFVRQAILG